MQKHPPLKKSFCDGPLYRNRNHSAFNGLGNKKRKFFCPGDSGKILRYGTKSVNENGLEKRIKIFQGDLKNVGKLFTKASFNAVTCNPPYMPFTHGKSSPTDAKAIARHEVLCNINDVISSIDYLLHTHGQFFMIHKPERLQEIFTVMSGHHLEAKKIRFIHPFADDAPNLVLIEGRKNAEKGFEIEPPLVIREKNLEYTDEVKSIYEN